MFTNDAGDCKILDKHMWKSTSYRPLGIRHKYILWFCEIQKCQQCNENSGKRLDMNNFPLFNLKSITTISKNLYNFWFVTKLALKAKGQWDHTSAQ